MSVSVNGLWRSAAVIACGLLALSILQAPAQASPQAGSPCRVLGKEVAQGGWVFVCTKKASKLVWVRKRAPQPPPVPDPVAAAWQRVAMDLQGSLTRRAQTPSEFTIEFLVAPSVRDDRARQLQDVVVQAFQSFAPVVELQPNYPVLLLDEKSYDFYLRYSQTIPGDYCGDQWWFRDPREDWSLSGAVCAGQAMDKGYMVLVVGSNVTVGVDSLIMHEVVHVVQGALLGIPGMYKAECWLGEGMAELYAAASLVRGKRGTDTRFAGFYRLQVLSSLLSRLNEPGGLTEQYWLDLIVTSEDRGTEACWKAGLGYSLGLLVTERLVHEFGEGKLLSWLMLSGTLDSDSAFTEVFGVTQAEWYERSAAPYVLEQLLLLRPSA